MSRLYSLDVLRLILMGAIGAYHTYDTLYGVERRDILTPGFFFPLEEIYMRILSPSGLSILGLSVFLFGWRGNVRTTLKRIFPFIAVGIITLFLIYNIGFTVNEIFWEWDVYHYLLIVALSLWLISYSKHLIFAAGALGFVMTLIPFHELSALRSVFTGALEHIFLGVCGDGRGGWALLPWLGFPWVFLALGELSRKPLFSKILKEPPRCKECLFWVLVLVATLPQASRYFYTDTGPGFYCYIFRQNPVALWGYMAWILLWIRLSFVDKWNQELSQLRLIRAISNLTLNRNFALWYLTHLVVVAAMFGPFQFWLENDLLFDLAFVIWIPVTEIGTRTLLVFFRRSHLAASS